MKIEISPHDDINVLSLTGQLDGTSAPELEKRLRLVMDEGELGVILDFSGTDYVSSAGLRVLLATAKRCGKERRQFMLAGVNDDVMEVLKLTGFHRVLDIRADLDQALAAVAP